MPMIRPMQAADAEAVLAIQRAAYPPPFHESWAVLGAKLALYAAGCWVAEAAGRPCAYLFSHPGLSTRPATLHGALAALPAAPDCHYLHDLALHPAHQGAGLGSRLRAQAVAQARSAGFHQLALVAVQGSRPFWERQGFVPLELPQPEGLQSYGADALAMVCALRG